MLKTSVQTKYANQHFNHLVETQNKKFLPLQKKQKVFIQAKKFFNTLKQTHPHMQIAFWINVLNSLKIHHLFLQRSSYGGFSNSMNHNKTKKKKINLPFVFLKFLNILPYNLGIHIWAHPKVVTVGPQILHAKPHAHLSCRPTTASPFKHPT